MKSISKFVAVAAVILFASAASAGTLYWQVDDDDYVGYGAELWMDDGAGNLTSLTGNALIDVKTGLQQADLTSYENNGDMSSYRFFVELVNYADGTSTTGYKWGYGDLVTSGYVATGANDVMTIMANAAALGSFAAAPEPSSGLLLLMGGAMLALRRRRQK